MGLGLSIVGGSDTLLGAIFIHEVYEAGKRLDFLVQCLGSAQSKASVGKTSFIAMDTLNPHMTSLLILKNNKFCGLININKLKN